MKSILERYRQQYVPKMPGIFKVVDKAVAQPIALEGMDGVVLDSDIAQSFVNTSDKPIVELVIGKPTHSPLTVAVVLSGGQAPGGHNVIVGLYDALKNCGQSCQLLGVIGGPQGLLDDKFVGINKQIVDDYKNSGGFDMIRSGRTKLKSQEDFQRVAKNCLARNINALVIIGGDDSNTNAAVLAEWFVANNIPIQVVGVPKTIDGDLKNTDIEVSFGFDTACKTYAQLIGNIARDANSARKYWHFIRLMGRSASHITLECAFLTQPNVAIIAEEVKQKNMSLKQVAQLVVQSIVKRADDGNDFGIVLVPEGLIEFIPEISQLVTELNDLLASKSDELATVGQDKQIEWVKNNLSQISCNVFASLPTDIAKQMLLDRDSHGNVQVSAIETEKLLMEVVKQELSQLKQQGQYKGKFACIGHFFGYEGRSAYPSNFDADYCYALGYTSYVLVVSGLTGYIAAVRNLHLGIDQWQPIGVPLTSMMNIERRHGKNTPVIKKALVDLQGVPFAKFASMREQWAVQHDYIVPGPIQFFGPIEIVDQPPITLVLEKS